MSTVTAFQLADILYTGAGALGKTPESLKAAGLKKPLIVTDKGIVKVGLAKRLEDVLAAAGLSYALYDGTVAIPPTTMSARPSPSTPRKAAIA